MTGSKIRHGAGGGAVAFGTRSLVEAVLHDCQFGWLFHIKVPPKRVPHYLENRKTGTLIIELPTFSSAGCCR